MGISIDIQLLDGGIEPKYQTEGSAGMDLCCTEAFELQPMERRAVPTGVKISLPEGFEAQVRPRSGLALNHGIAMVNSPGTIDSDYRGEIRAILINVGTKVVQFERGDRVAQLVVAPVTRVVWNQVATLDSTDRGSGGFGSTGK